MDVSVRCATAVIEIDLPIRILSEMNRREHWRTVRKRAREQQHAVHYSLVNFRPLLELVKAGRIVVTFTRIAPQTIDSHDNLRAGFKACADAVARLLGIDDSDERIEWRYEQEHGRTYSARVRIEKVTA